MTEIWMVVSVGGRAGPLASAARQAGGNLTALVVGSRDVADDTAAHGPERVLWVEGSEAVPVEAYAALVAETVSHAAPDVVLATSAPAARVLLAAAAARLGAGLVPGVLGVAADGDGIVLRRAALEGRVVETLVAAPPVACIVEGGEEDGAISGPTAPVEALAADDAADLRIAERVAAPGKGSGLVTADRVVAVGRGLRRRDDLRLVEDLAAALDAEVGCSMPVADDLGWMAKERYIGRSGQHIAPKLYLALGIAGAPQHMEGVRDARVVVGVNSDPDAPIFKNSDFGIVADLYDVIPELQSALGDSERGERSSDGPHVHPGSATGA